MRTTARLDRCPKCGELHFMDKPCKPVFRVWFPEFDEGVGSGRKVHAVDHKDAAEKASQIDDFLSTDYTIIRNGGTDEVIVEDEAGVRKTFWVIAETVPEYRATEKDGKA